MNTAQTRRNAGGKTIRTQPASPRAQRPGSSSKHRRADARDLKRLRFIQAHGEPSAVAELAAEILEIAEAIRHRIAATEGAR